jgi:glycosyltransferase involved in cell wall biosynthesis
MKIIVLGTRGIPDIQGGVETHCEELYPRLVDLGHDITLITRSPYIKGRKSKSFKGVKLKHLYAPKTKTFEAIVHTFLGVVYAGIKRPDYLHIHTVGPMLLTPFAKLLGLKVIVTNHGPDYNRDKWGKKAKSIIRLGENLGSKYADKIIIISKSIKQHLKDRYNRDDAILILNGVNRPKKSIQTDFIKSLGLEKRRYIIFVGRFVPEKGLSDLIEAYSIIKTDIKLVLVGDADHENSFSRSLKNKAGENRIILTGFIKGERLNQIFSHAKLFILPSYHEGLPISLLEAMSYDLDILVSDIQANLEVNLNQSDYFKVGDIQSLKNNLKRKLSENNKRNFLSVLREEYSWDSIAIKFSTVLKED